MRKRLKQDALKGWIMKIYHSEPYRESMSKDPTTFPLMEFNDENKPYSGNTQKESNDKPHQVYCENCEYRTVIQGIAGARCGHCQRFLVSVTKRQLDELVKRTSIST
jgi:hypothetical protein